MFVQRRTATPETRLTNLHTRHDILGYASLYALNMTGRPNATALFWYRAAGATRFLTGYGRETNRVIVAPSDVAPAAIEHPTLFQPKPNAREAAAARVAQAEEAQLKNTPCECRRVQLLRGGRPAASASKAPCK